MKTRIELWKKYRYEIAQNAQLKQAVVDSDKKMQIIQKRILALFPNFFKKHKINLNEKKIEIATLPNQKLVEFNDLEIILEEINNFEKQSRFFLKEIDKLSFSSSLEYKLKELNQKVEPTFFQETQIAKKNFHDFKLHIAIDGPSASGKSSLAKAIAKKFNLKYINTGLVYRAIAFVLIQNKIKTTNEQEIKKALKTIKIALLENENVLLNNQNISLKLREDQVSKKASLVASLPFVRKFAIEIIKKNIENELKIIMDGRDTTFRILPQANLKFFVDSTAEQRAKRRFKQNQELGFKANYEEILQDLIKRDKRDYSRKVDPLQIVKDALVIDSTKLTFLEVVALVSEKVEAFLQKETNEK